MAYHNGALKAQPKARLGRSAFLGPPQTRKYRASNLASGTWHWALQRGSFSWSDIGAMRRYHTIEIGLRTLRAPIHSAKREIEADSQEVAKWIDDTYDSIWHSDLDKILRMLEWGVTGGENVWKENPDGLICYDYLKEIHPYDVKPLELDGQMVGLSVRTLSLAGHQGANPTSGSPSRPTDGTLKIPQPRAFWIANEAEFGNLYGYSRLQGAFESWMERCGKHGAVDVRRLWFIKNVFRGGMIRHPMGTIEIDSGRFMNCEEYAREIIEKMETGGVLTLPDTWDPDAGHYRWDYIEPKINGSGADLLQYPKDLDLETLMGMGIMPEVIQAAGESSGGWSGRSVPMLVFLKSEDRILQNVIQTIDKQIIRPGVDVNFGPSVQYKVKAVSLVPDPGQQPDQPGQQPGQPGQPGQQQPGQQQPGLTQGNGNSAAPLPGSLPRSPAGPQIGLSQITPHAPRPTPHDADGWVELPEGF